MANFCTKCGSALGEGSSFCTACGTPAGAAGAPVAGPAQPLPITPQSPSALKIVLIIVAVFVGLGILSAMAFIFGVWRVARAVKVRPHSRDGLSISTPMGNMTMGTAPVTEAELGAPIYPNAKRDEGNFQISTAEGSMATYVFKTSDSPAQVMAFYRDKLGSAVTIVESGEGGMITSAKGEKEGFMITVGRDRDKTVITVLRGRSTKAP